MPNRERVLRLMQEETTRLNELAIFAEQTAMPGSAAILMQAAAGVERATALERVPRNGSGPLVVNEQHLHGVEIRQDGPFFSIVTRAGSA